MAVDGVERAVSVRRERHGDRSAELHMLQYSFVIPKVPQAFLERTVQQAVNEPNLVGRSPASALTAEKEQRERQPSQSGLTSKLFCRRYDSMWSPIFRWLGGKTALALEFLAQFWAIL